MFVLLCHRGSKHNRSAKGPASCSVSPGAPVHFQEQAIAKYVGKGLLVSLLQHDEQHRQQDAAAGLYSAQALQKMCLLAGSDWDIDLDGSRMLRWRLLHARAPAGYAAARVAPTAQASSKLARVGLPSVSCHCNVVLSAYSRSTLLALNMSKPQSFSSWCASSCQ